jgi:phage/plasmid-like protein (TIGR03299 family)
MAHEITIRADGTAEAAFAMTPAWHGLGVVLDHPMPSAEALTAAQLDWQVIQREVACIIPETVQTAWGPVEQNRYQVIPGALANCRSDNGLVLGTVSDQYQVVQNLEAFQFLDELIENHEMQYESAFSLQGGRKVVLLGRLPKVDTVVSGDDSLRYILMSLHHDGSGAIRFGPCATRVVCANTYAMALQEGYVKELAIAHKGDVKSKLAQARSILGAANEKFDQYAQASRALAQEPSGATCVCLTPLWRSWELADGNRFGMHARRDARCQLSTRPRGWTRALNRKLCGYVLPCTRWGRKLETFQAGTFRAMPRHCTAAYPPG